MLVKKEFLLSILSFAFFHNDVIASDEKDCQAELAIIYKQEQISIEEENISVLNAYLESEYDQADEYSIANAIVEIASKRRLIESLRKEVDDGLKALSMPEDIQILEPAIPPEQIRPGKRQHDNAVDTLYNPMKQAKVSVSDTPSALGKTVFEERTFAYTDGQFSLKKLENPVQHRSFLLEAIGRAKKHILMTSYTFRDDQEVVQALLAAASNKVKVYLYYNDSTIDDKNLENLDKMGINLRCIDIHSKILSVDDKFITIGSYNWLSADDSLNQTAVFEGRRGAGLKQYLWDYIKQYAGISSEDGVPEWKIRKTTQKFKQDPGYNLFITTHDQLTVLTTPFQHQMFFVNCFKQSVRKVVVHAPFITGIREFLSDFVPIQEIRSFFQANKILEIVYRAQDPNVNILMEFMNSTFSEYQYLIWTQSQDLHKKSIIVDDNLITVGSFNWFSSARDLEDEFKLMETTLVLKGESAKQFLS